MKKEFCPHCGQAIMKHKHTFAKSLAQILLKIAREFGPDQVFHIQKSLSLTKNEHTNYQRLQYWNLLEKHRALDGTRHFGEWKLTRFAGSVLRGQKIARWVKVFNGKVVEKSEEQITMYEAVGYYDLPDVWAKRAEPMTFGEDKQMEMFNV